MKYFKSKMSSKILSERGRREAQVSRGHHTSAEGVIIGTTGRIENMMTDSQRSNKKAVLGGLGLQRAGHVVKLTGHWAHAVW